MERNRKPVIVVAVCALVAASCPLTRAQYGGGAGEPNDPYLIYTAEQMNAIGADPNNWDKHFKLMADLDLSAFDGRHGRPAFNIIGIVGYNRPLREDVTPPPPAGAPGGFTGVFDGNGHSIANFNHSGGSDPGLFGKVSGPNAEIKNLGLIDPNVDTPDGSFTGVLIGLLEKGTLVNCYIQGGVISGHDCVGGLVGFNKGTIVGSYTTGNVTGTDHVGGLVGWSTGTISGCHSAATVSGGRAVGGLVGLGEFDGTISGCYTTGSVVGTSGCSGGLVGEDYGTIDGSHSTAAVTGDWRVGGLVGESHSAITDCYATGDVTGNDRIGGLVGWGYGKVADCRPTGKVVGDENVGGIAGSNSGGIVACYSTGSVSGDNLIGGLVGTNEGDIISSYSTGAVYGFQEATAMAAETVGMPKRPVPGPWPTRPDRYAGGLVGSNRGSIMNCYSVGAVHGTRDLGGFVGYNLGSIMNCYSIGPVHGSTELGGFAALGAPEDVIGSFWDIETGGQTTSAGGRGKTTGDMKMATTFLGWGALASEGVWTIDDGNDYPRLLWENESGELIRSAYVVGTGTPEDPYLIYIPEDLILVGWYPSGWDKHFRLMADVDLFEYPGKTFAIGDAKTPFGGVFDGNGHTISNLNYISADYAPAGLFGRVEDPNAEIRDLGLIDPNVDAPQARGVGSLVGYLAKGTVRDCYAEGGYVLGRTCVGGLVGEFQQSLPYDNCCVIQKCHSTAAVRGESAIGGLLGRSGHGIVVACYATGTVTGGGTVGGLVGGNSLDGIVAESYATGSISGGSRVGGLLGSSTSDTIVRDCYAFGSVSGSKEAGGLVGWIWHATIADCYAAGLVKGGAPSGGLVGYDYWENSGIISSSFWDAEATGQATSAGGESKTTAEMQNLATFVDAGWDFIGETDNGIEDIWWIDEGQDYPRLWWEAPN